MFANLKSNPLRLHRIAYLSIVRAYTITLATFAVATLERPLLVEALSWIDANLSGFAYAVLITTFFVTTITEIIRSPDVNAVSAAVGMSAHATAGPVLPPSDQDELHIAAHEAGHALLFAALSSVPRDLTVTIAPVGGPVGCLGRVTRPNGPHRLMSKQTAEWEMLVLLAGSIGERHLLGWESMGASNDHQRWLDIAQRYLMHLDRGIYYGAPSNAREFEHDRKMLADLLNEQQSVCRIFFSENGDVHRNLVSVLLAARTMDYDALAPFLERVVLPAEIPSLT